jgi:hypothetical protein
MLVEPVEPLLPESPIRFEPIGDLLQCCPIELARTPLRFPAPGDQARAFQYFQMLGDCRLADAERLDQFIDGRSGESCDQTMS